MLRSTDPLHVLSILGNYLARFVDEPPLRAAVQNEAHLARVRQHLQNFHGGWFNSALEQALGDVSVDLPDNLPRRQTGRAVGILSQIPHSVE